jgi:hypothetical protein
MLPPPPDTGPLVAIALLVFVALVDTTELEDDALLDFELLDDLETDLALLDVDVVGGGLGVEVDDGVGFGLAAGGGGLAGCSCPPKFHEASITPSSFEAKNSKSEGVKSSPPKGHPGHSSMIWAWVDFPLKVIVIISWQCCPPAYCGEFKATMKSPGPLVLPQAPRPGWKNVSLALSTRFVSSCSPLGDKAWLLLLLAFAIRACL